MNIFLFLSLSVYCSFCNFKHQGGNVTEIKVGTVTIVLPEGMVLDPRAGKLSDAEKRALPKARKGIGLACEQIAAAMEKSGARCRCRT
jgi:hypothetical protein